MSQHHEYTHLTRQNATNDTTTTTTTPNDTTTTTTPNDTTTTTTTPNDSTTSFIDHSPQPHFLGGAASSDIAGLHHRGGYSLSSLSSHHTDNNNHSYPPSEYASSEYHLNPNGSSHNLSYGASPPGTPSKGLDPYSDRYGSDDRWGSSARLVQEDSSGAMGMHAMGGNGNFNRLSTSSSFVSSSLHTKRFALEGHVPLDAAGGERKRKTRNRKPIVVCGLLLFLVVAGVVGFLVYWFAFRDKGSSSSSGKGNLAVWGTNGSTVFLEDGSSFVYTNPHGGWWYYDVNDPFSNQAKAQSWTPGLNGFELSVGLCQFVEIFFCYTTPKTVISTLFDRHFCLPGDFSMF